MYLLAPFNQQNLKKILRANPKLWGCAIFGPICTEPNVFGRSHYYYFHLPISAFHCAKFKKNSYRGSRVPRMHHFWAQNGPIAAPKNFLEKIINLIFIYLSASIILQNFKIFFTLDPELWGCTIFGPKMAYFSKGEFFLENLLISLVPFIHA